MVKDTGHSDHFFIHCNLSFDKAQPEFEKVYRKIGDVDIEVLSRQLIESPLLLHAVDTVSDLSSHYNKELTRLVETHAPLKRRKLLSRLPTPWYTQEITLQKRKRHKFERKRR